MRHRVAQALCNSGQVENLLDFGLPVSNRRLALASTAPELSGLSDAWRCRKRAQNGIRQDGVSIGSPSGA
jgi:hypothetical protein